MPDDNGSQPDAPPPFVPHGICVIQFTSQGWTVLWNTPDIHILEGTIEQVLAHVREKHAEQHAAEAAVGPQGEGGHGQERG